MVFCRIMLVFMRFSAIFRMIPGFMPNMRPVCFNSGQIHVPACSKAAATASMMPFDVRVAPEIASTSVA